MSNRQQVREAEIKLRRAAQCGGVTLHDVLMAVLLLAAQVAVFNDREEQRERQVDSE